MMRNTAFFFFMLAAFLISLPGAVMAETASARETPQGYLPAPLVPRLSADGKTLFNAVPVKAVVVDPNPSAPRRKIPAPAGMATAPEAATASFSITYVPNGGTDPWGANCLAFPENAKAAFNAAANIWANTISSPVPITISACWASLASPTTLGYSGGGNVYRDFSGAPRANTWFAVSLANSLYGSDIEPGVFDMHITYNQNFTWYYGTDGNTPTGQYDLMSVVLHEIAHGLNFSGSMDYAGGFGSWGYGTGYPDIYDTFMRDGSGALLTNYTNGSAALGSALTSNNIWFHGSAAMAANSGQRVKMYAPGTWTPGSSYSHLDYNTFNNTSNQLMVWAFSDGESVHDPGAVTRGLFQDLGWTLSGWTPPPPSASFPWTMFRPAINGGGSPPVPTGAYWGVDNEVCCTTSSATLYFTLAGVTKTSSLPSCAGPSSWGGWVTTTAGAKTFSWEWTASGCSSYMGTVPYTLQPGLYHLFVLGWNGSDFTMTVYTGTTAFSAPAASGSSGALTAERDADTWQRVEEIVLDIPELEAAKPKGILKATN